MVSYSTVLAPIAAAWAAPRAIETDLPWLLAAPANGAERTEALDAERVQHAMRTAQRSLRLFARLPGRRWKNTCLFRSVAECLVLRHLGLPAQLVIGVEGGGSSDDVLAHAWVECADVQCTCTSGSTSFAALTRPPAE